MSGFGRVLITGGCGFIGSNFVRFFLRRHPDSQVVNLDKLTYAGNPSNLQDLRGERRYQFIQADVADPQAVAAALRGAQAVVHFAAESHVDRSILDGSEFIRTNVMGTHVLLEAARKEGVERFLQISTDEVYGSWLEGEADEDSRLHPNSPYAASKTAADHLVTAHHITYGLPVVIVRGSNNFGPYQLPEKFLPLMVTNALEGQPLPIYGDGQQVREWLFVEDFCEGIDLVLARGTPGNVYNIGSGERRVNLEVAQQLLTLLEKPADLIRHVTDRPGHDRRYAISSQKVRALGWRPPRSFEERLKETLRWYEEHEDWWRPLKSRVPGSSGMRAGV